MPRRDFRTAKRGQVYASEWPEWHVDCAIEACNEHRTVSGLGEAMTAAEAEKDAKSCKEMAGWVRVRGLWYCPAHNPH